MPVNRYHLVLLLLLVCGSCIEPYEPEINESQDVLVISGVVTDQPGFHYVTVSSSAPYNLPEVRPVSGCVVTVEDESGQLRVYEEQAPGLYEVNLESSFLGVGKSYSLYVVTPNGGEYRSEYDTILICAPVDTIFYEVQSQGTSDPAVTNYGIQFYNNLEGADGEARSFRWILTETWEYNSPFSADVIFDGHGYGFYPGYEMNFCYMTQQLNSLYTASTQALADNRLNKNALNYVSNQSPRLSYQYSLLIEQQSLTSEAYTYWDKMKTNSNGGGLYETQPSSTIGNIYNITRPDEKVLGCFYATQVKSKRIIVENTFDFDVTHFKCRLDTIYSLDDLGSAFPYYGISMGQPPPGPPWMTGANQCFDCQLYGGSTVKPEYW
ncbi:MAG: hypothetical protein DRJ13_11865 [Bacteroidetes bacterium]|nr:MAG: hypothetical protein DRJ13_11865 [Bacteroidota bacterium]